jgi:hypothetical protein
MDEFALCLGISLADVHFLRLDDPICVSTRRYKQGEEYIVGKWYRKQGRHYQLIEDLVQTNLLRKISLDGGEKTTLEVIKSSIQKNVIIQIPSWYCPFSFHLILRIYKLDLAIHWNLMIQTTCIFPYAHYLDQKEPRFIPKNYFVSISQRKADPFSVSS